MDQWNGKQCAFVIKMFYKNNDSLEGFSKVLIFLCHPVQSKLRYLKFGWPANFSDDEMEKMFLSYTGVIVVDYKHSYTLHTKYFLLVDN